MNETLSLDFSMKVSQAIEVGLDPLGQASKKMIYWFLEQNRHLTKDRIVDHPTEFVSALKSLLGSGGDMLERGIIRQLGETFHVILKQDKLAAAITTLRAISPKPESDGSTRSRLSTSRYPR